MNQNRVISNHNGIGDARNPWSTTTVAEPEFTPNLRYSPESDTIVFEAVPNPGPLTHQDVGLQLVFFRNEARECVGFRIKSAQKHWQRMHVGRVNISDILRFIYTYDGTPLAKEMVQEVALPLLRRYGFDKIEFPLAE